jgi:hypothetical protein
MQPVQCTMSARVAASMSGSAMTSETAKRPPGCSTRAASAMALVVAGQLAAMALVAGQPAAMRNATVSAVLVALPDRTTNTAW